MGPQGQYRDRADLNPVPEKDFTTGRGQKPVFGGGGANTGKKGATFLYIARVSDIVKTHQPFLREKPWQEVDQGGMA